MVVFTAPTVTANESVIIEASFAGEGVYQPSSATAQVTVIAAPAAQPKATTLKISPTMFEVHPGDIVVVGDGVDQSHVLIDGVDSKGILKENFDQSVGRGVHTLNYHADFG